MVSQCIVFTRAQRSPIIKFFMYLITDLVAIVVYIVEVCDYRTFESLLDVFKLFREIQSIPF